MVLRGPAPEISALAPAARAQVAATWGFRARAEQESSLRFRRLASELGSLGGAPVVIALAREASHDEHRHAQLCAALCRRYGGVPPRGPAHDHPASWPGLAPRDRTLYELVSFCCIAETINAHLLTAILRTATDPDLARVVRRLLKDEVMHSRVGWAHLAAEHQSGRGAFLSARLVDLVSGSVEQELFEAGDAPLDDGAAAHGELSRASRLEVFRDAIDNTILPGFEMFGLDIAAARSWMASLPR